VAGTEKYVMFTGSLKMREWTMREHIADVENVGVEIPGATKHGKPSEENKLKHQTKYGFHAYLTSTCCQTQLTSESAC